MDVDSIISLVLGIAAVLVAIAIAILGQRMQVQPRKFHPTNIG
jgi:hypothetical protein